MKDKTRTGIEILQAALIMGFSGNMLLRGVEPGVNVLMWIALLAAAVTALRYRKTAGLWSSQTISLNAALIFFAAMFAFRDSTELLLLDILAVVMILGLLILPAQKIKVQAAGLFVYAFSVFWAGMSSMFAPFFVFASDIKWGSISRSGFSGKVLAVTKGLLVAIPLVLIFGGLLMSADADYQSFVENTFRFDGENAFANVFFTLLVSWFALGYLRVAVSKFGWSDVEYPVPEKKNPVETPKFSITEHDTEDPVIGPKQYEAEAEKKKPAFEWGNLNSSILPDFLKFGKVETIVVLGLMNVVFLSFVIIQIPYLFGGMELVQSTPDFKLAEYARRGVGELINVSLLVLPILLGIHWLLRKDDKSTERVFKAFAAVQIGLLFVIMFSAVQRLLLLTGSLGYGLTATRFYAMFWLIFLAMVFVWFGMTVLRGMRINFAWGVLWSGLFIIAALHFVNPDDFIVRKNIELMKQGRSFDATYNSSLSADAVPALLESYSELSESDKQWIVTDFGYIRCRLDSADVIPSWNASRKYALSMLKSKGIGCVRNDSLTIDH